MFHLQDTQIPISGGLGASWAGFTFSWRSSLLV